jgi:Co/Zn/Cd efflux system component
MHRSVFHIAKMDCPSEERLIRMALGEVDAVRSIVADIARREIVIVHGGPADDVLSKLHTLNLGAELRETGETTETGIRSPLEERGVLIAVLAINAGFFVAEMVFGLIASSMGLVADSLDMLADAFVYGISLYAVGGSVAKKKRIAAISGYAQLSLAVLGFIEVLRRVLGSAEVPDVGLMIGVSLLALAGNAACLVLLQRLHNREAHMQASLIFTSNDVIANAGVIAAGLLVSWLGSNLPDLVVGALVFVLVTRGAVRILRLSR